MKLIPSSHDHQTLKTADALRPLRGRRLDAILRQARQTLHDTRVPGTLIEMSRGARYRVNKNGSYIKSK